MTTGATRSSLAACPHTGATAAKSTSSPSKEAAGGWDIEHPDSIAAIGAGIGKRLNDELGIEQLTLGVFHGENRAATTMAATWVRDQMLEDGSYPLGLKFQSKHGGGNCWAYWLRRRDYGLDEVAMESDDGMQIHLHDQDLLTVSTRFGIKLW
jgi:hypothetical protein